MYSGCQPAMSAKSASVQAVQYSLFSPSFLARSSISSVTSVNVQLATWKPASQFDTARYDSQPTGICGRFRRSHVRNGPERLTTAYRSPSSSPRILETVSAFWRAWEWLVLTSRMTCSKRLACSLQKAASLINRDPSESASLSSAFEERRSVNACLLLEMRERLSPWLRYGTRSELKATSTSTLLKELAHASTAATEHGIALALVLAA